MNPLLLAAMETATEVATQAHVPWHRAMLLWTIDIGLIVVVAGMLMCIVRLLRGPHLADRALSVDTIGVQLIGVVLLLSMRIQTLHFIDGILVLSLLGFAGAVAMAQYIGRPHLRNKNLRPLDATDPQTEI